MALRDAIPVCLYLLLGASVGEASGLEPGSPLMAPQRPATEKATPQRAQELSLTHFLESPGKEPARVKLWLQYNREARALEAGAREFLERLIQISAEAPKEIIFSHERVMLDAEALATDGELVALADARTELLARLGRTDPDFNVLEGETPPPWSPEGRVDREALTGLVFARTGRAAALPPDLDRLLVELASLDKRLGAHEQQLLPVAEEALGAVLLGLASGEATMAEVVHGLHFLKHQQRRRLDLRLQRELLLLEVARRAGCTVEDLPRATAPDAG
ncbi:hypothetical protein JY651_11200 [Pyxidicoccus parkwayensis]|uniref:Uncharacterized protein n=1 Tax=Pyxidicoccus parkwayensis TaxID=2813578 RepID=A0ABX7P4Y2_9BACT|nr:hypothetical protein [Pyxidicoccus parkwaysis]QSQ25452.1 hypothetical protein JY651_11200 [Pyxidicoccus parkwaysis]